MANGTPLRPGTRLRSHLREYTVLSTLGSGGFGITYLVEATFKVGSVTGKMKFAIKEHYVSLLCERDNNSQSLSYSDSASAAVEKSRRAFIKEAQRVKNLGIDHPNIVPINEVFEANNTAYYVMEYLEGQTLSAYVSSRGTMTFNDTITLFRPIIDAVAVLHTNKLTHYDIKPANIILTHAEDGSLRPVLIDFGLAKHYDEEGMDTSTLGTGGYSAGYSPVEQYPGLREFTPQADVYALAASMYYCLIGEKPDPAEKFSVDDMASRLSGIAPAWFIDVMKQAMAFRQSDRIPNANTLYIAIYGENPTRSIDSQNSEDTKMESGLIDAVAKVRLGNGAPHMRPNDVQTVRVPKKQHSNHRRSNLKWLWIVLVAIFIVGILFYMLKNNKNDLTYKVGEAWTHDTLIASDTITMEPTDDVITHLRDSLDRNFIPSYRPLFLPEKTEFFETIKKIEKFLEGSIQDTEKFDLNVLSRRTPKQRAMFEVRRILPDKYCNCVIAVSQNGQAPDSIFLSENSELFSRDISTTESIFDDIKGALFREDVWYDIDFDELRKLIVPNIEYDASSSLSRYNNTLDSLIKTKTKYILPGTVLINEGDIVTSDKARLIDAYVKSLK